MSRWDKGSASTRVFRWVFTLIAIFFLVATIPVIGPKTTPESQCNARPHSEVSAGETMGIRAEFSAFPLGLRCFYERDDDSGWIAVDPPWVYTVTLFSSLAAVAVGITFPLIFRNIEMRKNDEKNTSNVGHSSGPGGGGVSFDSSTGNRSRRDIGGEDA
ncbi:hypothetical protein GRS96_02045 [Rathayibacter sp. VKM Ac-2803]|uniref:hypothetical protein n=1 Tax=Rathayibacter sp. VKM Ac-2803 TaxID=2609256 RepID=UPI001358B38C|nr:hypothetical protein [Rathayibacter sp. VKM Ac-2803]MWV48055.1 hypothetical protein [Rathayibacter sp. VKM Ac-2803]